MINRREFLGITAGAGASLAFSSELLHAFQQLSLIFAGSGAPGLRTVLETLRQRFPEG